MSPITEPLKSVGQKCVSALCVYGAFRGAHVDTEETRARSTSGVDLESFFGCEDVSVSVAPRQAGSRLWRTERATGAMAEGEKGNARIRSGGRLSTPGILYRPGGIPHFSDLCVEHSGFASPCAQGKRDTHRDKQHSALCASCWCRCV
jgi:hypothetical protein